LGKKECLFAVVQNFFSFSFLFLFLWKQQEKKEQNTQKKEG